MIVQLIDIPHDCGTIFMKIRGRYGDLKHMPVQSKLLKILKGEKSPFNLGGYRINGQYGLI